MTGGSRPQGAEQRASSAGDRLAPYRFKPGQSGNPTGRKSRQRTLEELCERVMRERKLAPADFELAAGRKIPRLELLARVLVGAAERGDLEALRMLFDRLWPKPIKVDLEIPGETLEQAEQALERRVAKAFERHGLNGHSGEPSGSTGR